MELKLKPCPFCQHGTGHVRLYKNGYRIVCKDCGAGGPIRYIQPWHDSKFVAQCQAAKAWNVRANTVREKRSPCDLCQFNPPSSTDGKPCSICPASATVK